MPLASVIIPAYRPQSLDALAVSVAANRDVDAEWIVVDDGSGPEFDSAFDSLRKLPVRLLRMTENRRQGAARNAGLAQATSNWIKFLDADDRLDEGHLAALLAAAQTGGAIPFAPTRHVFSSGRTSVNDSWRDLAATPEAQLARLLHRPFLHHCGALFPRELLERLGGYDESLVTDEDGDLLIRVLMSGAHFMPVPGVQYHYIHGQGSGRVSADDDLQKMQARLRVCDKVEDSYGGAMPDPVSVALAKRLDRLAMTYYTAAPEMSREVLARAQKICPSYVPDMRIPIRLLRQLGGPPAALAAINLYRWIRGRPKGGTQG